MKSQLSVQKNRLLPIQDVSLATFVTSLENPSRNFCNSFVQQLQLQQEQEHQNINQENVNVKFTKVVERNVYELSHQKQVKSSDHQILEMLHCYVDKSAEQGTEVKAIASTTYELQQWNDHFKIACQKPATQKWLEDAIAEGDTVYFVVGFRTFSNPSALEFGRRGDVTDRRVEVPTATVMTAAAPVSVGIPGGPGTGRGREDTAKMVRAFKVEGEMVYAIQYCQVRFKWYSSKKVEKSRLGPTKWMVHWGVRSAGVDQEEDVVEAMLEEEEAEESEL